MDLLRGLLHTLVVLVLIFSNGASASQSVIKTLPGYPGTLPFKLETGYIGVGENEELQLFYYFIESESNPETAPLFLFITGGPGCTGLSTIVFEIGPFAFDVAKFDGSLPSIRLHPHSWTKVANIIFIDMPVGTGFSYAKITQDYTSSDTKSAIDGYTFLRKWLLNHPTFMKSQLYLAGESYGGKLVPLISMEILRGNDAGLQPRMSLKWVDLSTCSPTQPSERICVANGPLGYIIGNGLTDPNIDFNARIPYAHHMALISDEYFESAKSRCAAKYFNSDPNNLQCQYALQQIKKCTNDINPTHILERKCEEQNLDYFGWDLTFPQDNSINHLVLPTAKQDQSQCRLVQDYAVANGWANNPLVQEALHVRRGTVARWITCHRNVSYEKDVEGVLEYHKIFTSKGYDLLIFNGDHDMAAPYLGPLKWMRILNLTVDYSWRPWFFNGQIAGYTEKYKENNSSLTFATIKGAGHTSAQYKPQESLAMLSRWLNNRPL